MEQWLLTLLLAITATNCQIIDGPYRRGPVQTNDQVQERYIETDYYDTSNDDDRGNLQYLSTNDEREPEQPPQSQGGERNRQRVPNTNQLIRKGAPLEGLIYDEGGDGGYGYNNRNCKVRTLPQEDYCDVYYSQSSCDDGKANLRSCPNGLVYTGNGRNGLIGVCDYAHRADCTKSIQSADGYTDRIDEKQLHNPPISTEHCDWLYGIFGHETSCTRYWTCWNGTATEQFCIGGLLYNEDTHACDWPQNVAGCQKHPLCKDDANGNVPLGKSCNRYWACQGGYPRLQRCPAMLVFDKQRKRCVAPPTADCDIPPTPPPSEDDDRFNGRDEQDRPVRNRNRNQDRNQNRNQDRNRNQENQDGNDLSGAGPENRRRFQSGGGGGGAAPRREARPERPSQGRPQPQQDFNVPDGALPLNRGQIIN